MELGRTSGICLRDRRESLNIPIKRRVFRLTGFSGKPMGSGFTLRQAKTVTRPLDQSGDQSGHFILMLAMAVLPALLGRYDRPRRRLRLSAAARQASQNARIRFETASDMRFLPSGVLLPAAISRTVHPLKSHAKQDQSRSGSNCFNSAIARRGAYVAVSLLATSML